MKTTLNILLLLLLSACCKNETEPDPCSTETRVRFFNGTDVSFDKIIFYNENVDYAFDSDILTPFFNINGDSASGFNILKLHQGTRKLCKTYIDYSELLENKGCYTIYISEVDTLHVFNDTTLWYKVIKN